VGSLVGEKILIRDFYPAVGCLTPWVLNIDAVFSGDLQDGCIVITGRAHLGKASAVYGLLLGLIFLLSSP